MTSKDVRKLNGRAVEPYRKQILGLPETIRRAHDEVRQLMRDGVGSIVVELGNDARARYRGADTGLELQPRLAADAPTMDVVGPAGFGTPRRSVDIR